MGQKLSAIQWMDDGAIAEAVFLRRMGTVGESQPDDFLGLIFSITSYTSVSVIARKLKSRAAS